MRWKTLALAMTISITAVFFPWTNRRVEAVVPVIVAVGVVDALIVGAGMAATIGIISVTQSEKFKRQMRGIIRQMTDNASANVEELKNQAIAVYNSMVKGKKKGSVARDVVPARRRL